MTLSSLHRIKLLLLIHPFLSSFFFLSNFQTLQIFVTFLRKCHWGLQTWNLLHTVYHVYRNQAAAAAYVPLFLHLSFNWWIYRVYRNQTAHAYSFFSVFLEHLSQRLIGEFIG